MNRFVKLDIEKIVSNSLTIFERLNYLHNNNDGLKNLCTEFDMTAEARIKKWMQKSTSNNFDHFEKRLSWLGADLNEIKGVVSRAEDIIPIEVMPEWANILSEVVQSIDLSLLEKIEKDKLEVSHCLVTNSPIAFEEILLPFVNVARKKLLQSAKQEYNLLQSNAQALIERSLLGRLSYVSLIAFETNFSAYRYLKSRKIYSNEEFQSTSNNTIYRKYVKRIFDGGIVDFLEEYSVLARLLGTIIKFWLESTCEFLFRLKKDTVEIEEFFQDRESLGKVVSVECSLSDHHNCGRSSIFLLFESGLKLLYKPKNMETEEVYSKLLDYINSLNINPQLKTYRVINKVNYGWSEFVEHLPCQNSNDVESYYKRAGMLLCIVYALEGTDCHSENIVASGEHPVIIDLETLMTPYVNDLNFDSFDNSEYEITKQLTNSVLRTGLLPRWDFEANEQVTDIGGFGAGGSIGYRKNVSAKNINTDQMHLSVDLVEIPNNKNVPYFDDSIQLPQENIEHLILGFRQMYDSLLEHKHDLIGESGPLSCLKQLKLKFIFRPSKNYTAIIEKTLCPEYLCYGIDRSIELEILARAFLADNLVLDLDFSLLEAEILALENIEIPVFSVYSGNVYLNLPNESIIDNFFKISAYDAAIRRIESLCSSDLERQVNIIKGSFFSRVAKDPSKENSVQSRFSRNQASSVDIFAPNEFVENATLLAKEILDRAISLNDNSITWIDLAYVIDADRYQLEIMNYGLYDGFTGTALFLAALEKVTRKGIYKKLVLQALKPLRNGLYKNNLSHSLSNLNVGATGGWGSIVYALVKISYFLEIPELLDDAKKAASFITSDLITSDTIYDVSGGCAGAILCLLSCYEATSDSKLLTQAVRCGKHLINSSITLESGEKAWLTLEMDIPLTGFAHGAAGIAYAFYRLYQFTKDRAFYRSSERCYFL